MPPSAAASKSTRLRSEPGDDGGLAVCVTGEGAAGCQELGIWQRFQGSKRGVRVQTLGNLRIPHEGCGCSGRMGTLETPAPIGKGSGGIRFGVLDLGSKKDLVGGRCLQGHGNQDVQIPLEWGGRGEDSDAGCGMGTQQG